MVGATGMIEPNMGRKIVKDLIIKWDPEVHLGCLVYESWVVFRAGSFYDSPEVRSKTGSEGVQKMTKVFFQKARVE